MRLYVAGSTANSLRAVMMIRKICAGHPECDLEIIDIYQLPAAAVEEQIVAVPTLVRKEPLPPRRFIGDLSDESKLRAELGLLA